MKGQAKAFAGSRELVRGHVSRAPVRGGNLTCVYDAGILVAAYLLSRIIGDKNRNNICLYMSAHIGATNEDCANAIGLSSAAVGRHIRAIKAEWQTPLKKRKSK